MSLSNKAETYTDSVAFELGFWVVAANDLGITRISFAKDLKLKPNPNRQTEQAKLQLEEYFSGSRKSFDLELDITGHTAFHQKVWNLVSQISHGCTKTYSQLADELSNPLAVRAVGTANGRNPFPLVIPCHRVIGKNNKLTGYAYGLELKEWLLIHEGAIKKQPTLFD